MVELHIDTVSIVAAVLGLFILVFGLFSMPIKEWLYLSEALVATIFGILMGPAVSGLIHVEEWGNVEAITKEFSRFVIAISVMAAGIALPKAYLVKEWRTMTLFLLPIMLVMWLVSAGIMYGLLPVNFLEALLLAACITPTDPVLSNSIVKGRFADQYVPDHLRNALSAESGANDGLGFPYLYFAILFLRHSNHWHALGEWVYAIWLYQIVLSLLIGAIIGYVARKLLYLAESREWIDKESFLVFSFALTMFILGSVYIIGSDDLFAVFIAGNAFTWDDWFRAETQEAHLQEVVDMLFNLSFFVLFGAIVPWSTFQTAHEHLTIWRLVVVSLLLLVFRRLPIVLAMKPFIPVIKTWREAAFAGWFGPMGVGALFYATVAIDELDKDGYQGPVRNLLFPVISFIVLSSVIVHGITVPVFQLSTSTLTRTLTNPAAIAHLVQRLPLIRPGQEIIIRHTHGTTQITVSRPNSMYQQPTSLHAVGVLNDSSPDLSGDTDDAHSAHVQRMRHHPSRRSLHSVTTRHSLRTSGSYIEECHTFSHDVQASEVERAMEEAADTERTPGDARFVVGDSSIEVAVVRD